LIDMTMISIRLSAARCGPHADWTEGFRFRFVVSVLKFR
jgi:hypothetical protein